MENNQQKLRQYFLETLSPQEIEETDLKILTNSEFAAELDLAETELLEDYLEDSLSDEEVKLFETNYLITTERRNKLEFVKSLKNFSKKSSANSEMKQEKPNLFELVKSFFRPRQMALGFGSLALISAITFAGYFVWKNYKSQSDVLIALNNSQKNERPLESRISDFDYAPKIEGTRGGSIIKNEELEFAELSARNAVRQNPSAENLHELGRVFLTQKKFDEAIEQLEKGIKKNPNISKLHNDLGVAFLEKGSINRLENEKLKNKSDETKPYLELFVKANEEFGKAIELDKTSLESNFNQALAIESLNLPNQAKEAWENYLKLDSTSKWADEARERLKKLESNKPISKTKEEILVEFFAAKEAGDDEKAWQVLSRNREMITGKLIPQQLAFLFVDSKVNKDDAKANEVLDALVYAGKLEEEKAGDLFWRDLAGYYQNSFEKNLKSLQINLELVKEGYKLRQTGELSLSIAKFIEAKEGFKKVNNNVDTLICDYWIATLLYQLNEVNKSNSMQVDLAETSEKKKYKWLAAQAYVRLSYGSRSDNNYSNSIEFNKKALKFSNETQDLYNLQRTYTSLAFVYRILGRYDKSFNYSEKSLILQDFPESSSRQKWLDFEAIMETLFSQKKYRTAILFQNEALALDKIIKDEGYKQMSNNYLGMLYTATKDFDRADFYFRESIRLAEKFTDQQKKLKALSISKLRYAYLKKTMGNFEEAVSIFKNANDFNSSSEFQLEKFEGQKGELFCYLALKDEANIQKKLPEVLTIFNAFRRKILEEQSRNSFFDNEQDVYDIATEYEFSKGNYKKAFDFAEESRSRSLLDLQNSDAKSLLVEKQPEIGFSTNISKPVNLENIQNEMNENIQLLVYSVLAKQVLIWIVTKDSVEVFQIQIDSEVLQDKVTNYIDLIAAKSDSNELLEFSKELYRTLFLPIKEKLDSKKQLFIIPDKILFRLPFASLFSDKYLLEDYEISYAPSANVFLNCSKTAKELNDKRIEKLLSIGNPSFNKAELGGNLQSLPSAKIEAEEIARQYQNSTILTENIALKDRVKSEMKSANVIHFAGHYVIDESSPLLSGLILTGDNKSDSILANYEFVGVKLSQTRLIVLSACDTEIEKIYKGEGMIGVSRMFLAANIPLVVASRWKVDSEATKDLMIRFHQIRKSNTIPTSEALRLSQMEMLKNEKYQHPYYWSAFTILGGFTEF